MSILAFIVLFVLVGVGMWALNRFVPMQANIKSILNVVITIVMLLIAVIFVLSMFGVSTSALTTPHRVL